MTALMSTCQQTVSHSIRSAHGALTLTHPHPTKCYIQVLQNFKLQQHKGHHSNFRSSWFVDRWFDHLWRIRWIQLQQSWCLAKKCIRKNKFSGIFKLKHKNSSFFLIKYWEGVSFDGCGGHPDAFGVYHNHINPICYYGYKYNSSTVSTSHSPIIGYMFDSYPIYGPFGYSSANNSASSIKRMTSGYSLRSITDRTTLSNGTVLSSYYYGPAVYFYFFLFTN
jgi:hypothetical protein